VNAPDAAKRQKRGRDDEDEEKEDDAEMEMDVSRTHSLPEHLSSPLPHQTGKVVTDGRSKDAPDIAQCSSVKPPPCPRRHGESSLNVYLVHYNYIPRHLGAIKWPLVGRVVCY
jgi:hypothetical protein